jgi:hypothetical protein
LSTSVDRQVRLSEGKNNVSIIATDRAGNSASESTTVIYNRQIKPSITIHRNQTRIITGDLNLGARVAQGEITRVSVEAIDLANMDVLDLQLIYSGSSRERVDINQSVNLGSGRTQIRVTATDSEGEVHTKTLIADSESGEVLVNGSPIHNRDQVQAITETRNMSDINGSKSNNADTRIINEVTREAATSAAGTASETANETYSTKIKTAGVSVTNASVNRTQIRLGDTIRISASVENTQRENQTITVPLIAGEKVLRIQKKTVPGNSAAGVSFQYTPDEAGNISLRVGSASTGEVTVSEDSNIVPSGLLRNVLIILSGIIVGVYLILKSLAIYLGY